ncbi:MAG TPA: S8/S53 family peptidase [Tepidisphaeraceae bacterium]|nr:S8/S53 family peptidase [Tepidisphaeraceae bacterium]
MSASSKAKGPVGRAALDLQGLEGRTMFAWSYWPTYLGFDKIATNYPWLNGGTGSVAVIDKGIDYFHPQLNGNQATNTVSPSVVNVYDYKDNDNTPFPNTSEDVDPSNAHGTGVAGILKSKAYNTQISGVTYYNQGLLQSPDTKLYNLRTNSADSQTTIRLALQWVLANHAQYNIVAVNLTDFIGSFSNPSAYATVAAQLKAAGIFITTPVANEWLNPDFPKFQIGNPGKDPSIYAVGGIVQGGAIRAQTQRGPGLDLLAPAEKVTLPYYVFKTNQHTIVNNAGEGNSWGNTYVTAAAVLIKQIDPTATPDEVMQILKDAGTPTLDTNPPNGTTTPVYYSALNAYAAVNLAYQRRDDVYDQGSGGSDDLAHAGIITLNGSGDGGISNLKLLTHDADYYKFTATSAEDFDLKVTYGGPTAFPTAELLDSAGNVVANITSGGITRRLSPGDYYIRVASDVSLEGTYSVTVGEDAPTPPPPGAPGKDGTFNGLAYDSAGALHWAWFDDATNQLKYAKRTGNTWSAVQVVDPAANTGTFMSMALDNTGKPGVAYYDEANTDLKYARFNGSAWQVETVDSSLTTGYYPSLKYGPGGAPAIAFYYKSSGDLKFATKAGGSWAVSTVDSKGDVGRYPSLALNEATGRWGVAYEKTTTGDFRVAEQNSNGTWSITVVDATKFGGGFTSMQYVDGRAAFSYYDAFNADLKFARWTGTKWLTQAVAAKNSQGLYTNLFFDPGNDRLPVIYYFNKTANTAMVARGGAGGGWSFEVVASGGGRQLSVALDPDQFETFAYSDDASGDLFVAQPA